MDEMTSLFNRQFFTIVREETYEAAQATMSELVFRNPRASVTYLDAWFFELWRVHP